MNDSRKRHDPGLASYLYSVYYIWVRLPPLYSPAFLFLWAPPPLSSTSSPVSFPRQLQGNTVQHESNPLTLYLFCSTGDRSLFNVGSPSVFYLTSVSLYNPVHPRRLPQGWTPVLHGSDSPPRGLSLLLDIFGRKETGKDQRFRKDVVE